MEKYLLTLYIVYYITLPIVARNYKDMAVFDYYALIPPVLGLLYFGYRTYIHYSRAEKYLKCLVVCLLSILIIVLNYWIYL
jgi:hypothetical protein